MSKVPCGGFELDESLALNNGKLGLAPGAGGGGAFVVSIATDESASKMTADKTYAEISEAAMGNNMVVAVISDDSGAVQYLALSVVSPDKGALFSGIVVQSGFPPSDYRYLCCSRQYSYVWNARNQIKLQPNHESVVHFKMTFQTNGTISATEV